MNTGYQQAMQEKVGLAIQMDDKFTQWQAELTPDEAILFMEKAEIYNNMTRSGMVGLIRYINDKAIPRDYGPNNPNTGTHGHKFRIGNEGSRVVYAIFPQENVPKDEALRADFFIAIETQAKERAGADEFNISRNPIGWWEIRMWWD